MKKKLSLLFLMALMSIGVNAQVKLSLVGGWGTSIEDVNLTGNIVFNYKSGYAEVDLIAQEYAVADYPAYEIELADDAPADKLMMNTHSDKGEGYYGLNGAKKATFNMPEDATTIDKIALQACNVENLGRVEIKSFYLIDKNGNKVETTYEMPIGWAMDVLTPITEATMNFWDAGQWRFGTLNGAAGMKLPVTLIVKADELKNGFQLNVGTTGQEGNRHAYRGWGDGSLTTFKTTIEATEDGEAIQSIDVQQCLADNAVAIKHLSAIAVEGTLAGITKAPTAANGIMAESTDALVSAGTASDGTMMYAVTTTNAKPTDLTEFSETLPTATNITDAGTAYVWFYAEGANEYLNSDIFGPVEVTILPNKFDLGLTATNSLTIEGGMATLTVGSDAKTPANGKVADVKIGSTVTLAPTEGYLLSSLTAKKGEDNIEVDNGSFTMPGAAATATYTLKRDMGYAVVATVCDGAESIRVKPDGNGKFQPLEPLTYTLTDYIGGLDKPVAMKENTDYKLVGMHVLDGNTWKDVTDMNDLVPGTYEMIFEGQGIYEDKAYSMEFDTYVKTFNTKPEAVTSLVYSGQPQALITEAELEDGEMRYSFDGNTWSTELPTGTDAGTYNVYYKVVTGGTESDPQKIENIEIAKATLTSVTLEQSKLNYDTFGQQPQTVVINSVKADGVEVPAEFYTIEGDTQTEIGDYTLTTTIKADAKNFTGSTTTSWSIVKEVIAVDGENVPITVTADKDNKTLTIDEILQPKSGSIVHIPAEVNGFQVTAIATGALTTGAGVTDVYMPNTEETIAVGVGALPANVAIHTTLAQLDDYALMATLKKNFEGRKVMTTVTPKNTLWTLSSGVDLLLPEGVIPNRVSVADENTASMDVLTAEQLDMDGEKVLKACNGVVMSGEAGQSYDLVARPGRQQSGSAVNTADVKDYGTNLMEAVIESKHVAPNDYYVLKDNTFNAIEDNNSKVPAGKAVLKKPDGLNLARVLNIADGAVTGISEISGQSEISGDWYDLNGRKLQAAPTTKGIFIKNGKKVVVK